MPSRRVEDIRAEMGPSDKDNLPKGAKRTKHQFRTDVQLRDNEEMFRLTDDEILPGDTVTPEIQALGQHCCRGAFHHTKHVLANIYRVHGEGIKVFGGDQPADPDEGIMRDDPVFGWDMTNRAEGFPCTELLPNGHCKHHAANTTAMDSNKPHRCKLFPQVRGRLEVPVPMTKCSYTFDANGTVRSGSCDGCAGIVF